MGFIEDLENDLPKIRAALEEQAQQREQGLNKELLEAQLLMAAESHPDPVTRFARQAIIGLGLSGVLTELDTAKAGELDIKHKQYSQDERLKLVLPHFHDRSIIVASVIAGSRAVNYEPGYFFRARIAAAETEPEIHVDSSPRADSVIATTKLVESVAKKTGFIDHNTMLPSILGANYSILLPHTTDNFFFYAQRRPLPISRSDAKSWAIDVMITNGIHSTQDSQASRPDPNH